MAEGQKPVNEDGNKDLADRVGETAKSGGDLSGFHDEIASLSNNERLDFIKNLKTSTWQPSFDGAGNKNESIFVDPAIDKTTGAVLDIDLFTYSKDSKVKTRTDLYTPNEKGAAYDKRQEMNALAAPYRQLLGSMNSPLQETPATPEERTANAAFVKGLLAKHTSKHPDKEAIFSAFEKPYAPDKDVEQDFMDYSDDNTQTPAEVQNLIDAYRKTQRRIL